jgi:double-strand break repair protein MRE11
MEAAMNENVDFVILGGDLFHDSKPSMKTIYKTSEIFKDTVLGGKDIEFDLIWGKDPNFKNENVNISIPVFIVSGNHDCQVFDFDNRSAQDLLEINSYLNRFGQEMVEDKIVIKPLIFIKGNTKICLYGIGHMKDKDLNEKAKLNKIEWI